MYETLSSAGRRKGRRVWSVFLAVALLTVGLIALAFVIGPSVLRFLQHHWKAIVLPTAGFSVGAGMVILVSLIGRSPLRNVAPPRDDSKDPLREIESLAERTARRLRVAYLLQLGTTISVGVLFLALIAWSMVMVSQERILYASAFGSGGVATAILTKWKWQPFDRINQARKLADDADILATGLRLRMKTIAEIADPVERSKAQWEAVSEYLKLS